MKFLLDTAIASVNRTLNRLGVKVPSKVSIRHAVIKLFKVMMPMRSKTDRESLSMPYRGERQDKALYALDEALGL